MRRATRALVVALALVVVMAFSAGQALAGWGWEDCPPASQSGFANRSDRAAVEWEEHVYPQVNSNAVSSSRYLITEDGTSVPGTNPGQK